MMRINNKMKDSNVEYEEWWEVAEEYFVKELEKNLAQHKVDGDLGIAQRWEFLEKDFHS
jgi:hypothetical protein